jgi:hypothetical protein
MATGSQRPRPASRASDRHTLTSRNTRFRVAQLFLIEYWISESVRSLPALSRAKQSTSPFGSILAFTIAESEMNMKWIEPLERFVEAIAVVWLLDLVLNKPLRSRKLTRA